MHLPAQATPHVPETPRIQRVLNDESHNRNLCFAVTGDAPENPDAGKSRVIFCRSISAAFARAACRSKYPNRFKFHKSKM
jgi:hypothetical protein